MEAIARALDSDLAYRFRRSPVAMVAALVVVLLIGSSVFAPLITSQNPFDPGSLNLMNGFSEPMQPDMLPLDVPVFGLACSPTKETGHEAITVFGRADHRHFEGASGGHDTG